MTTESAPITLSTPTDEVHDAVRARYAEAALAVAGSSTSAEAASRAESLIDCCAPDGSIAWGSPLYGADDRASLPDAAVLASLGCGNPIAVAELREGETVLDLGSGGGIDVLLSARRVGPTGRAIGIDMTEAMAERARVSARAAGLDNVEVRLGDAMSLPLEDSSADVVISNGVLNLTSDKSVAFGEVFRVLKPGGRLLYADIVVASELSESTRKDIDLWTG